MSRLIFLKFLESNMGKICPICDKECDSLIEYQYGEETKERCSQCKNSGMKSRLITCPRCGKQANYLQEYRTDDGEIKKHCSKCQGADHRKQVKRNNRKKFFIRNWDKWIFITIGILGLIGVSSYLTTIKP